MSEVIVTESNNTAIVQQPQVFNVVVDESKSTVIVTGMMPPPVVGSLTTSTDVNLTQLQQGGILTYDTTTGSWVATNAPTSLVMDGGEDDESF